MASPTVAANAYASLARMMERGGAEKAGQAAAGPSFGALVKEAVGSVMEAGKKSDAQTMAMFGQGQRDGRGDGGCRDRRRGLDPGLGARPGDPGV
jgi:flagellar hook-basal body complex protein FliE